MVAPLVGIAAAAAARAIAAAAGKKVVSATMGKQSAAKYAASKAAANARIKASQTAVKTIPKKKIAEPSKASVKVLPRKTAPKTDLSNRGTKLTRVQRSERAQDYQFDRSLGKYYSNQDRIAGTNPSELARGSRGQGVKSARKTAAIKKEAKPVVKINSQSNLKKKVK
jgi:hypothetical protein